MPLVLSLKEGEDFFVDDVQVVIDSIESAHRFWVTVPSTGKRFEVTDDQSTEIVKETFVSSGGHLLYGYVRIAIDAPQHILILRGDRYRKGWTPPNRRSVA